jgi:hypothetical protein
MFQNTPIKVDTKEAQKTCDACTLTTDLTTQCDSATLTVNFTVCDASTQTETRYVMTTNQSVKIKSWVF